MFYTWEGKHLIQRIEIQAKDVIWNQKQTNLLAITSKDSFFLLEYQPDVVKEAVSAAAEDEPIEEGVDDSFEVISETFDKVESGIWINKVFFYLNQVNKLNFIAKEKVFNYCFIENAGHILGHLKNQGRLYLNDKKNNVISQELPVKFSEAISNAVDGDYKALKRNLKGLKSGQVNKIARFLEGLDKLEVAFEVVENLDTKFGYAIRLGLIQEASELAEQDGSSVKWKKIGDLSLQSGDFDQAEVCFKKASDYSSLFLLYSSLGKIFPIFFNFEIFAIFGL